MGILTGYIKARKHLKKGNDYIWMPEDTIAKSVYFDDDTTVETRFSEISQEMANVKKSVSDGKKLVADAITAKKVPTAADATFATMASNIAKIKLGSGNATAEQVLSGVTFTGDSGVQQTGTMPNNGAWTGTTTGTGNVSIPKGYHNGNGYVSGKGAYDSGYSSGRTQGQNDVKGSPNSYGLYTSSQYSSYGNSRYNAGYSAGASGRYKVAYTSIYMSGNTLMNANFGTTFSSKPTVVVGSNSGTEVKATVSNITNSGCTVGSSDRYATVYIMAYGN